MNPFFVPAATSGCETGDNIYKTATNDIIELSGIVFKFLERTVLNSDIILGDTLISRFSSAVDVTLKLDNYQGFEGASNIFSQFGFEVNDQLILLVSRIALDEIQIVMQEGDLLYHNSGKIFEIKDVKDNEEFVHFGVANMFIKLTVEPYNMDDEDFQTGIKEVDSIQDIVDTNDADEDDEFSELRDLFLTP